MEVNLDEITINNEVYVKKSTLKKVEVDDKFVLIRGDRSGVFFGQIDNRKNREVTLLTSRRIWYWDGAFSLHQLALEGTIKPENCKFSVWIPKIIILDAIEVIPCTSQAIKSISEVKQWKK